MHEPDLAMTTAAAYPIFTIGRNVSGVFTATDGLTKATLLLLEPSYNTTSKYTVTPLAGKGLIDVQLATNTTVAVALYQAADGKVGTAATVGEGEEEENTLAFGQAVRVETKVSNSNNYGQVIITR